MHSLTLPHVSFLEPELAESLLAVIFSDGIAENRRGEVRVLVLVAAGMLPLTAEC